MQIVLHNHPFSRGAKQRLQGAKTWLSAAGTSQSDSRSLQIPTSATISGLPPPLATIRSRQSKHCRFLLFRFGQTQTSQLSLLAQGASWSASPEVLRIRGDITGNIECKPLQSPRCPHSTPQSLASVFRSVRVCHRPLEAEVQLLATATPNLLELSQYTSISCKRPLANDQTARPSSSVEAGQLAALNWWPKGSADPSLSCPLSVAPHCEILPTLDTSKRANEQTSKRAKEQNSKRQKTISKRSNDTSLQLC
jgi:hypothetical protein